MFFLKIIVFASFLLCSIKGYAEIKPNEEIAIKINLICPPSEQLEAFKKALPDPNHQTVDYENFQRSFNDNMIKLMQLIESGNVLHSDWSVKVEPNNP